MRPGTASSRFHETLRKLRHFCFFIVPPDAATQRIADLLPKLYHKCGSSKVAQASWSRLLVFSSSSAYCNVAYERHNDVEALSLRCFSFAPRSSSTFPVQNYSTIAAFQVNFWSAIAWFFRNQTLEILILIHAKKDGFWGIKTVTKAKLDKAWKLANRPSFNSLFLHTLSLQKILIPDAHRHYSCKVSHVNRPGESLS